MFRRLSVDFAAKLAPTFPYLHTFVLLHRRPSAEVKAIVGKMDAAERLMFFDELPEQSGQQLMDAISSQPTGGAAAETLAPAEAAPAGLHEGPPILRSRCDFRLLRVQERVLS